MLSEIEGSRGLMGWVAVGVGGSRCRLCSLNITELSPWLTDGVHKYCRSYAVINYGKCFVQHSLPVHNRSSAVHSSQ